VWIATGEYAKGSELTPRSDKGRGFTLVSTEAEYAFGYTKLAGEVTRDVLETAIGSETAYGWFLQGSQTLSPRWFVAARQEGTNTPPLRTRVSVGPRRSFHITEATVGFRLSTEITLRGSFVARKSYTRTAWDQQVGTSLVWTRRWW